MFSHSRPRKQLHMASRAKQRSTLSSSVFTALLCQSYLMMYFSIKTTTYGLSLAKGQMLYNPLNNTVWLQLCYTALYNVLSHIHLQLNGLNVHFLRKYLKGRNIIAVLEFRVCVCPPHLFFVGCSFGPVCLPPPPHSLWS